MLYMRVCFQAYPTMMLPAHVSLSGIIILRIVVCCISVPFYLESSPFVEVIN